MARSAKLFNFAGVTPQLDDSLLDANVAMVAEDIDLERGDLMPLKASGASQTELFTIKTLVDVNSSNLKALSYATDVAFTTPAWNDLGRVAWIKDGKPRYCTQNEFVNNKEYFLGVKRPVDKPYDIVQLTGGDCSDTEGCKIVSGFCSTYVNAYGQESAPSLYSHVDSYSMGDISLTFNNRDVDLTGEETIKYRRIYRSIPTQTTGVENQLAAGGDWFLVGEVAYNYNSATTTVTINNLSSAVEILPSLIWEIPPSASHLAMFPDTDSLVLASNNTVFISEPGNHHAFPRDRDIVISDRIVALQYFAGNMIVLTDGHPYIIAFQRNDAGAPVYNVERENEAYPCLNKQSVSVGTTGVVWASTDGVFTMNKTRFGINIKSLTNTMFHHSDWTDSNPASIRGELHNGAYYFTSSSPMKNSITGHLSYTWVLTYDKTVYDQPKNIFLQSLSARPNLWYKSRRDKLYAAIGFAAYEWNPTSGSPMPYLYTSRLMVEPGLTNYSAAKVVNDRDGDLVFELWRENGSDPYLLYSRKITHSQPFRLPPTLLTEDHFVKLKGTSRVRRVHLADSLLALTRTDDTTMTHGNARITQR